MKRKIVYKKVEKPLTARDFCAIHASLRNGAGYHKTEKDRPRKRLKPHNF